MRNIRQLVYDRKFMEYGADRPLATAVHAYLGNSRDLFIKLFPRYRAVYDELDAMQSAIATEILGLIEAGKILTQDEKSAIDKQELSPAALFAETICKKITIDPANAEANKHIYGMINNPKYTRLYVGLLNNATNRAPDNATSDMSSSESVRVNSPADTPSGGEPTPFEATKEIDSATGVNGAEVDSEFCEMIAQALKNKPELWT
jgi:hypothetical protein